VPFLSTRIYKDVLKYIIVFQTCKIVYTLDDYIIDTDVLDIDLPSFYALIIV